ncbi:hypothetical protein Dacet_1014 [Denitrovibrio acetiphilus DSM 12809]|uniref:Uncharacterized protein n=1 Tax=Denitrovibrio acetiphilus (strain DSM 12809 / NBRC 114555 / N2460) TaxID=522772 RepID=D4H6S4_DENA2|nr:multiheme c-type cytochrome [Denitrovibrio acetiphilus]ADD67790.1 hypothetical protein Dacet_1014 [Denitrovibrio acetiphilus DSM 12809]
MRKYSLSLPKVTLFLIAMVMMLVASTGYAVTYKDITLDAESQKCVDCHEKERIAPKVHDQYAESAHAQNGIGCLDCHSAEASDFDAYTKKGHPVVASHPTPKDCATCHEQEVEEHTKSKHAYPFWLYAAADRAVFEPIVGTKQGCENCHNLSAMWPDGSVGECDICHSKHSFDVSLARNPNTCGECHLGPDHPQKEIYYESKHGNIFAAKGKDWDLSYNSSEVDRIPIEAPVCSTCHMDAVPGTSVKSTHNVSERLAWEAQAPWSYRTIWFEEELGTWEKKAERMKTVCKTCHAPTFIDEYILVYDLVNLQYNEIRRQFVYWTKKYESLGLIKVLKDKIVATGEEKQFSNTVLNASWYTAASELMYNSWHHEGRRFRMGSAMAAADYVQWHGIWELQHNLQAMIAWGAERGVEEAKKIYESDSPAKFFTYKLYDFPGSLFSIVTAEQFNVPALYKIIPDYWEKAKANVEQAYKKELITEDAWNLWMARYDNLDKYLGKEYPPHPIYDAYDKRRVKELNLNDPKTPLYKAVHIDLPSPSPADELIK